MFPINYAGWLYYRVCIKAIISLNFISKYTLYVYLLHNNNLIEAMMIII